MGAAEGARLRQERTAKLTPPLTPPPTTTPANTPPAAEGPDTMLRRKVMVTAYMKGVMARIEDTFKTTEQAAEPRRRRRRRREEAQRRWHRRRRQRRDAEAETEMRAGQQRQGGGEAEQGQGHQRRRGGEARGGLEGESGAEWAGRSRGVSEFLASKRAESVFLDQSGRKRTSHYG